MSILKTKNFWVILVFSAIAIIVVISVPKSTEIANISYDNVARQQYNGIVIKKYIDYANHARPTIEIINHRDISEHITYSFDRSGIYEHIQVGDSIKKNSKSHKVIVKRGTDVLIYTLDYGVN